MVTGADWGQTPMPHFKLFTKFIARHQVKELGLSFKYFSHFLHASFLAFTV